MHAFLPRARFLLAGLLPLKAPLGRRGKRRALGLGLGLALTACSPPPPTQYLMEAPSSELRLAPRVRSIEIRDMSLPRYVNADGLTVQSASGALVTDPAKVWADDPVRGATLALTRHIAAITGARVAREPWPFAEPPGASISVTVEQFLASQGQVRLEGSYAIAALTSGLAERSGRFDIAVPLPPEPGPEALARAHGQALRQLAETLARRLAR